MSSFWIEIDIVHNVEVGKIVLDDGRFKSIHDKLPFSLVDLIDVTGKQGIYDSEKIRETLLRGCKTCNMRMI